MELSTPLELKIVNNKTYLNYWDSIYGDDITAELRGQQLYVDGRKVALVKFIEAVRASLEKKYENGF